MAGAKGRSGGARPGAGRKPKNQEAGAPKSDQPSSGAASKRESSEPVLQPESDMLTLLQRVALGQTEATPLQVRAAIAAVQYTHAKIGEGGKKEQKQKAAERAGARFAPAAPPRLAAVGGKAV